MPPTGSSVKVTISSHFVDPGSHSCGVTASACPGPVGSSGFSAEVYRAVGHRSHHQPHRPVALHPGRPEVRSPLGNCRSVSYSAVESWVSLYL